MRVNLSGAKLDVAMPHQDSRPAMPMHHRAMHSQAKVREKTTGHDAPVAPYEPRGAEPN